MAARTLNARGLRTLAQAEDRELSVRLRGMRVGGRVAQLSLLHAARVGAPMAAEFYQVCEHVAPVADEKHERVLQKVVQAILGNAKAAEIFLLSLNGLQGDFPRPRGFDVVSSS